MTEPQTQISGTIEVTDRVASFRDRGRDPDGALATALGSILAAGQVLDGRGGGFEAAVGACGAVEALLKPLLEGTDGLHRLSALRSVSPALWFPVPYLHAAARGIAELAVHKWCDFPDDPPAPYELRAFTGAELDEVADLLAAAEAYAGLMVARRRVAKGQLVTVVSTKPLDLDISDNTGGIADLITLRDQRVMANSNVLAAFSGILIGDPSLDGNHPVVAAEYVPFGELAELFSGGRSFIRGDGTGLGFFLIDPRSSVLRPGMLADLAPRTAHLSALDDDLLDRYGFGAADLDTLLECLSRRVTGEGLLPSSFEDCGFAVVDAPTDDDLAEAAAEAEQANGRALTADSLRAALTFLDAGCDPTPLSQAPLQRPLRLMGSRILYDGAHLQTSPAALWGSDASPAVSQKLEKGFEVLVHAELAALGTQPWPPGKVLKRPDGSQITDADASVQIDAVLVAVDCYGSTWNAALDEGTFNITRNRAEKIIKKLREWQDQWDDVCANYPHLLPEGVTDVLPIVVTPGAEWIESLDDDLWLEPKLPRICTVEELFAYLQAIQV